METVGRVKWKRVRLAAALDICLGLVGALAVGLTIWTNNTPKPGGGLAFSLSGSAGLVFLLGLLAVAASVLLFVPIVVITAWFSKGHMPANRNAHSPNWETQTQSLTALSPGPARSTSDAQSVNSRRERASAGANMRGLGQRRSQRVGWITVGVVAFFMVALGVVVVSAKRAESGDGGNYAVIAAFGFPALFIAAILGMGWVVWRNYRKTNNDQATYRQYYHQQPPDIQQWGLEAASQRQYTENVQDINDLGRELAHLSLRAQKLAESLLATFNAGPVPLSPWAQAAWTRFGEVLIGREVAMYETAAQLGTTLVPYVDLKESRTPLPAPTVLIEGNGSAAFYQQRNELVIEDSEHPVRAVDLVMLSNVQRQRKGYPAEYIPTMQTFSYVETWFPADHWLHVYPRTRTSFNRWGRMGRKIDATARQFNRLYNVQTDREEWAKLVLNPAVMKILVDLYPVRFTVDAGRVVLHTHNGWLPPGDIASAAETLQRIARSADAAER